MGSSFFLSVCSSVCNVTHAHVSDLFCVSLVPNVVIYVDFLPANVGGRGRADGGGLRLLSVDRICRTGAAFLPLSALHCTARRGGVADVTRPPLCQSVCLLSRRPVQMCRYLIFVTVVSALTPTLHCRCRTLLASLPPSHTSISIQLHWWSESERGDTAAEWAPHRILFRLSHLGFLPS